MRKWISGIATGFLSLLVLFFAYCQISMLISMKNNHGVPSVFGYSFLYVATDSMVGDRPDSLPVGSGIIIEDVPPEEVEIGDVITFYYPVLGAPDTHRVTNIIYDEQGKVMTFQTRGDNADAEIESSGETFSVDNYLGKMVYHSLSFGTFLTYVSPQVPSENNHATWVFPLLILAPLAIAAIYTIVSTALSMRKQRQKEQKELAQALEEANIDPHDEAAALAFEEKWRYKRELRESYLKEKDKEMKKQRRKLRKEGRMNITEKGEGND